MNLSVLSCPDCKGDLHEINQKIFCKNCNKEQGFIEEGIPVFHGSKDHVGFFDKQATQRLAEKYAQFTYDTFIETLKKTKLYEMDFWNKKVGIAEKFWWEKYLGKITNKDILEVGCGINYIVPYWLHTGNKVAAFDICAESVHLLDLVLKKTGLDKNSPFLFVADAERLSARKQYDLININNVLHHIKDKQRVLLNLRELLKDNGRLLIVEPNYYYPFRWIIETDFMESINFVKSWFVKHDLIEKGEKAVIFSQLKKMISDAGYTIEFNTKDSNYLGYGITYFFKENSILPRIIYNIDHWILSYILPGKIAPFEYLILKKN